MAAPQALPSSHTRTRPAPKGRPACFREGGSPVAPGALLVAPLLVQQRRHQAVHNDVWVPPVEAGVVVCASGWAGSSSVISHSPQVLSGPPCWQLCTARGTLARRRPEASVRLGPWDAAIAGPRPPAHPPDGGGEVCVVGDSQCKMAPEGLIRGLPRAEVARVLQGEGLGLEVGWGGDLGGPAAAGGAFINLWRRLGVLATPRF